MAKLLKLRRGTTSQHSSFTGAEGEVTVDTTKDTLVVHDGSTAGGVPLAKESANLSLIDEDNMSTNSATRPPSQQSVKAYVDTADALKASLSGATFTGDVTFTGDSANVVWDKSDNALEFATNANLTLQDQNIIRFTNGLSSTSGGNEGIMFGASGSEVLKIFNTTTETNIQSTASNGVEIKSPKFNVRNSVPNDIIYSDGAYVKLYYSDGTNSTEKLATSSSGVTVTGSLTISGGLTVNGTTTTVNTTNTTVTDNLLELNSGASSNANDAGILIERGSTGDNAIIAWDESADKFTVGTTTGTASSTGNISITTGTLVANVEGNVTGNASGSAATVTAAAQSAITSVGTLTGLTVNGDLTLTGAGHNVTWDKSTDDLIFDDSAKAIFGTSSDGLELFHNGSNSYIKDTGTGSLVISSSELQILNAAANEDIAHFHDNGAVELYHQNEKVFNTTSKGIEVRNTNGVGELEIYGSEGNGAELVLTADDGDDWTDISRLHQGNDGNLYIQNLTASSTWEKMITCYPNAGVELYYNNNKTFESVTGGGQFTGTEGQPAYIYVYADEGDDNADKWVHAAETNGTYALKSYSTGSWVTGLSLDGAGNVSDAKGELRSIPANTQSSAYTLQDSDAGKCVLASGAISIPDDAGFVSGDAVTIVNNSSSQIALNHSSVTIYNSADSSGAEVATLEARGMMTIYFTSNTVAYASGAGLG